MAATAESGPGSPLLGTTPIRVQAPRRAAPSEAAPRAAKGSIRTRLLVFVSGAVLVTLLAAGGVIFAARVSDAALERLTLSQHRLDLLAEVSGRFTDYALAAIAGADATADGAARLTALRASAERAMAAFDAIPDGSTGDGSSGDGRATARLRADFATLDQAAQRALATADAGRRGDAVRGALNAFALSAGPGLSALVEAERAAVARGRDALAETSRRLVAGAVVAALLAAFAGILLHRRITRPLLGRIGAIERAARAVAGGNLSTRLSVGAHDELGLVVARFNRMAAKLARREKRLAQDRADLESIIAERTADLTRANERLAAIDRSRRRFFADVSHELRTPLTVVLGECDVALRSPTIPEETVRPVLTTIRQRALRLHRRVEDLLRVARSESGEIDLFFQWIELGPVLTEAVESLAGQARRRGVALNLALPEAPQHARADGDWLRQVVEGLIDNALRHAKGAQTIKVTLEAVPEGQRITVADDGCGIPEPLRPGLFRRFARRELAEPSGFGLGLALAQWVVARHGGRISLAANPEAASGTAVTILLPATAADGEDQEETP
ncbi:ATP-binding protein [Zavarzinia sp.]|uniref:sensor histidine kinase n=1 Tax=Zavarzinia sp. TaxID=2027920 RepID=UPI003563F860